MTTTTKRNLGFLAAFLLVALVLAGGVSYFADSNPDGLDHATLQGCTVAETEAGEELQGSCIAQNAQDHPLSEGPFADYTVGGDEGLSGLAGVVGVIATLAVAFGLFWVLRKRPSKN
ncbi:PDGLE domain-containing protein [Actinokineospora pegani]|uniref:PDGLE domain-containing protein n=1 Tax=Actinokineospora pegani TaxID=2654637 RepID=UPI0012EAC21E|nr:PDGLE domain-containing protein [Actinokineospora pegani]